jgi:hypothetical protein
VGAQVNVFHGRAIVLCLNGIFKVRHACVPMWSGVVWCGVM